jgi:hypothetical protein
MKRAFWLLLLVLASVPRPVFAQAPPTIVLTQANQLQWDAPVANPLVTIVSYRGEFYLKAMVTCSGSPVNCTPTNAVNPPALTFDFGNPPAVAGKITTPALSSLAILTPGVEYFAYVRAIGTGTLTSPQSNFVGPFGFPGPPSAPTGLVVK